MRRTIAIIAVGAALAGALMATGCTRVRLSDTPAGKVEVTVDERSLELNGADKLVARVRMGAGVLALIGSPDSSDTVSARFEYAPSGWKPNVEFETDGTEARFDVEQPQAKGLRLGNKVRNGWNMKFPSGVPTDLSLQLGVGESTVDLRDVDVRQLEALTGVGATTIDLSGIRANDIAARIECGVGEVVVRVPRAVGVRIVGGKDGVGELLTPDFRADGDALVNDAYGSSGPRIVITLARGIGEILIEQIP